MPLEAPVGPPQVAVALGSVSRTVTEKAQKDLGLQQGSWLGLEVGGMVLVLSLGPPGG